MAKRTKPVQTNPSGEEKLVGGQVAQPDAAENRSRPQPQSARERSKRTMVEDTDRAAAAIPDIVRAENDERDRIAARAYELYQQRGGSHGRDTDDWLEAEREVGSRSDRPNDE